MTKNVTPRPRILFLSLTNNDGANVPVAELGRLGCACGVMSPPGFTCALSRFATHHFRLPGHRGLWLGLLGVRPALERVFREWHPDLVVPLDDVSAWLLRGLTKSRSVSDGLLGLLETSLGAPSGYDPACSRAKFLELATQIGVRAPRSRAAGPATAMEVASFLGFPVMLKLENSCGGFGVAIANDKAELQATIAAVGFGRWRSLTRIRALMRRCKEAMRLVVWKLAGLDHVARTVFELQQFVRGVPAMRMVATSRGRVLAGASFEKLCVNPPPFGASTVTRCIDHSEMEEAVRRLVAGIGCSGFASFDFIIEEGTGHAYVIEMNPRTTSSIHLGRLSGNDVCGAIVRQISGLPATVPTVGPKQETRPVACFPRELERDPQSSWLQDGAAVIHDVPWDDPPVFEMYYRRLLRRRPAHAATIARALGMPIPVTKVDKVAWFWRRLRHAIEP